MGEFLENYQKILFSKENDSTKNRTSTQRKCLTLTHNAALTTLDNQSTCHLLEKNLNKYYETTNKQNTIIDRVNNILSEHNTQIPLRVQTNIENIDLQALLTPFPCSGGVICTKSEAVSNDEFKNFKEAFQSSATPKENFLKDRNIPKQAPPTPRFSNFSRYKSDSGPETASKTENKETQFSRVNSSETSKPSSCFKNALEVYETQNAKKGGHALTSGLNAGAVAQRRQLAARRTFRTKFVSPLLSNIENIDEKQGNVVEVDDRLKSIDPEMVKLIKNEIMDVGPAIVWEDIAGLEFAKTSIQEAVVWPMLRPDIFTGLRRPPKGILLFGPPGTGKTLIGKCVASQSKSTFFSISASSLTSKWVGNGEKMVRALFAVARCHQPAVIFIDEIDSLLSQRSESEHESSRRIKTEFLVQLDGATTDNEERLLLIGATNRPQELDEAARRRFVKRLYIPLPEFHARLQLVTRLVTNEKHNLDEEGFREIAKLSEGYSGADMRNLCSEASLEPIRSIDMSRIETIQADEVRPLVIGDFHKAFIRVRSSVSAKDLDQYIVWDKTFGSGL